MISVSPEKDMMCECKEGRGYLCVVSCMCVCARVRACVRACVCVCVHCV